MLVLSSNFKFKNEATDIEQLSLIGTDKGFQLAHEFSTVRETILTKNLDDISAYAKRNKNPVKGTVIVRDSEGFFHRFKVTRNGYTKDTCDVNISIKNASDKKKSLTFNEKMDLLRKYVSEQNQLPESTTVINDCNLGTFVKKLGVDEQHVQEFVQIKDSIAKSAKRK
jgi:hypothetical protein